MIYKGIVENNNDPDKLGRIQIRICGIHTENKYISTNKLEYISTIDLPWALPAFPITSSSNSGEGEFAIPVNGSTVLVGFFDSDNQLPYYFATLPTIPNVKPSNDIGFSDPTGTFPKNEYLSIPSTNKLATGTNTFVNTPIAKGNITEPLDDYATTYPNNRTINVGKLSVEIDGTTNKERVRIIGPNKSYLEMRTDGTIVIKSNKDKYLLAENGKVNIYGKGLEIYSEGTTNIKSTGATSVDCDSTANVKATSITLQTPLVTCTTNLQVNGTITSTGAIASTSGGVSDSVGSISSMRSTYNAHTHTDPQGGNTGPVSGTM